MYILQRYKKYTVPLKSKLPPSRFSRVHWKYQYFAFVGIRNLFCVLRRHYHIISISTVDMIFILISNACVPCVCYKFSSV